VESTWIQTQTKLHISPLPGDSFLRISVIRSGKNYSNDYVYGARVEIIMARSSGVPRDFVGGVEQIQLRTEDREKGELGIVVP